MLAFTRTMLLWFSFDTSNSRGILKNIACVLSRMVVLRCVLSGMDKMVKNIIQPTNIIAATPGFSACLFGLQKLQPKESHLGKKRRYLLGLITCEHRRMWDTWVTLADNSQFKTYMGVSVLFLSSLYSHRTPRWFWLQLDLFEGRSCAALCVAKLATWLAPPHVCSLACSWPLPARRCFALWAPLPVLLQEAPRWSSLCGHRPCRWRREAAVRVPLATWVPTLTSLASPCLGLHPCLPTSAASSTHEKTWEDQRVAAAMI